MTLSRPPRQTLNPVMSINVLEDYPRRWNRRVQQARFEVSLGLAFLTLCAATLWLQIPNALSSSEQIELSKLTEIHAREIPQKHGLNPIYKLLAWQETHLNETHQITDIKLSANQLKLSITLQSANEFTQLVDAFVVNNWRIHAQTLSQREDRGWFAEFTLQKPERGLH